MNKILYIVGVAVACTFISTVCNTKSDKKVIDNTAFEKPIPTVTETSSDSLKVNF